MPLNSMTGFSRAQGSHNGITWSWELKSVNAKGFDCRLKVPSLVDGVDIAGKTLLSKVFARGTINGFLDIQFASSREGFAVNQTMLDQLVSLSKEYADHKFLRKSSLAEFLSLRGVLEIGEADFSEDDLENLKTVVLKGLEEAAETLKAARAEEGEKLASVVNEQILALEDTVKRASACDGARLDAIAARYRAKVDELLGDDVRLDADKVEQEVVQLAVKADIREELDRLNSHLEKAKALLIDKAPVGRAFDFLAQELNREANTLCSKSGDKALTEIGLSMKLTIDQLREQIQNVE